MEPVKVEKSRSLKSYLKVYIRETCEATHAQTEKKTGEGS